jgi:hypothetical protein
MNPPVIPSVPSAYLDKVNETEWAYDFRRAPTDDADIRLDLYVDGNTERASVLLKSDGTGTMKAKVLVREGTE